MGKMAGTSIPEENGTFFADALDLNSNSIIKEAMQITQLFSHEFHNLLLDFFFFISHSF